MTRPDHLVDYPTKVVITCPCGCGGVASRFMRCRKKRCVIASCSVGVDITKRRDDHERTCA